MNNWKTAKLGDLIKIKGGFGYKGEFIGSGDSYLLGMGCVSFNEKFLVSGARPYSGSCPDQYFVKPGQLVLATRQQSDNLPILGLPAIIPAAFLNKKVIVGANLYRVENYSTSPNTFLYWLMKAPDYYNHILSCAKGSTVRMITKDAVEGYEFLLPPLPEQQAIAEVLSSLDDKIDLLHRNNKTLEEVMNTFMRQWFLAEAEGEYKTTLKIGDCLKSVSTTHKFPSTEVVFLNTSDILLGRVLVHTTTPVKTLPGQAKKAIEKGDILFSEIRPANGRWAFVDFESTNYVVSTKLMVLRGTGKVSTELLYFYLTHKQTVDYLQMLAESRSGTFPQITYDQLIDLEIHLPNEESLIMASTIAKDTLQQLSRNNKQIVTLQNLRDTLLPKLMSGQVSVNIN